LFVSPRAGGKPVWLIDGAAKPSWSPDGSSLTFAWFALANAPPRLATLRVGPNQTPSVIPNVVCDPPLPVWSPSGEWIACETASGPVVVSPDGKRRRTLGHLNSRVLAWSPDSASLYGLHNERGNWSLVAENIGSGSVRRVADYGSDIIPYASLNYYDLGLSLSPDGKSFAVGTLKGRANLWILEGLPH
jgi:Tol biopolymer transport system component